MGIRTALFALDRPLEECLARLARGHPVVETWEERDRACLAFLNFQNEGFLKKIIQFHSMLDFYYLKLHLRTRGTDAWGTRPRP